MTGLLLSVEEGIFKSLIGYVLLVRVLGFVSRGFAFNRTKAHFIPAALPLFSPDKRALADWADLARKVRLFTHTRHGRIIAGFAIG
jgi:hypothetical protein